MKKFFDNVGLTINNIFTGVMALIVLGIAIIGFTIVLLLGLVWTILSEIFTLGCVGFEVCEYLEMIGDIIKKIWDLD